MLLSLLAVRGWPAVLPGNVTLYAATFGAGTFVSVGSDGAIFSSTNDGPWEQRLSGTTTRLEAAAFGGGLFVVAGENGTLLSSSDGVTWTIRSLTATQGTPQIAYGNGRFVVAGKGGAGQWTMLVSSNAVNWTTVNVEAPGPPSEPGGMPLGALAFGGGRFIAAGGLPGGARQFLTSTDGITWKEQGAEGTSAASAKFGPMIHGNGAFAVIENFYSRDDDDSGFYDRLLISYDGDFWSFGGFYHRFGWKAVAAGDCRWLLAANNPAGSYGSFVSASRDLGSFYSEIVDGPVIDIVNALAYGDGKFFAFGSDIVEVPVPPVTPLMQISPMNQSVFAGPGYGASFNTSGSCLGPPVFYQWRRNGVPIPDATNIYLQVYPVSMNDSGQYTVTATNLAGQTEMSVVAELVVLEPANAPPVVHYPTVRYTNSVPQGDDTSVSVNVSGWPAPLFQWRLNGVPLPGATNTYVNLINVTHAAEGDYTLFASNAFGTALSPGIFLDVVDNPPQFSTFTNDYATREESRFEFGYRFYTYGLGQTELHVFKNDAPHRLPLTAANAVALNRTALSDAGQYQFVLSNVYGMNTAMVANLTVNPAAGLDRWTQRNPLPQNEELFDAAYGNGVFVAVGNRGTITHSTSGNDWAAAHTIGEPPLSGVVFGNGVFVAVGGANIFTSTNGLAWAPCAVRVDLSLLSVVFANGRFVAVGNDAIVTSTDGVTWSDATLQFATQRQLRDVAFGNGTFVAVGDGRSVPAIWISSDATNWSPVSTSPVEELESVAFGNGLFVAIGDDGALYTSPNGTSWTARDSTVGSRLLGVSHGAGRFVAVGSRGRILSSANGTSWNRETSGTPDRLNSVRFANNLFVAIGENGTTLTSPNGTAWTKRSQGSVRDLDGMTQGAGLIVVAGKAGTILTSSNGTHFVQQNTSVTNDLHGVGYANGLFVAVGEPEIIISSSNAVQWQTRHNSGTSSLKNVRHGPNGWVAVGTEGVILASLDGLTWTPRESGTQNDLNDVVHGNGLYVVVGDNLPPNGTMLVSSDGVTWSRRPQFIGKNLRSVNYLNNTFIATANDENFIVSSNAVQWDLRLTLSNVFYPSSPYNLRAATFAADTWVIVGNAGNARSSRDAMNWTSHSIPTVENLHGVAFLNNRFVVVGNRGTILQSDPIGPRPILAGRIIGNTFQVTVTGQPGTFYELQSGDFLLPAQWTTIRSFTLEQPTTNILDSRVMSPERFYRVISR